MNSYTLECYAPVIKIRSRYCGLTGNAVKRKSQGRLKLRQNQAKKKKGGWGGQDNPDKIGSTHNGPEMKDMENIVKV